MVKRFLGNLTSSFSGFRYYRNFFRTSISWSGVLFCPLWFPEKPRVLRNLRILSAVEVEIWEFSSSRRKLFIFHGESAPQALPCLQQVTETG